MEDRRDLAAQIADRIEEGVRVLSSNPLVRGLRLTASLLWLIPLLALSMALVIVVLVIGVTRLLNVYVFHNRVWATYALLAFVGLASGISAWALGAHRRR
jgi:hypothetical protein